MYISICVCVHLVLPIIVYKKNFLNYLEIKMFSKMSVILFLKLQ